mmetsp:Transcript_41891/g.72778  ORF Transcript_41891/g.72778 Transcript_41891/m.72778 type:complete len:225 (-) Transcript_41891:940-1614(-)
MLGVQGVQRHLQGRVDAAVHVRDDFLGQVDRDTVPASRDGQLRATGGSSRLVGSHIGVSLVEGSRTVATEVHHVLLLIHGVNALHHEIASATNRSTDAHTRAQNSIVTVQIQLHKTRSFGRPDEVKVAISGTVTVVAGQSESEVEGVQNVVQIDPHVTLFFQNHRAGACDGVNAQQLQHGLRSVLHLHHDGAVLPPPNSGHVVVHHTCSRSSSFPFHSNSSLSV